MKILSQNNISLEEKIVMLGNFDGFHIGHNTLINEAIKTKTQLNLKLMLTTFLNLNKDKFLYTLKERESQYKKMGFDFLLKLDFEKIKNYSGIEFLSLIKTNFNAKVIICGEDFKFGKDNAFCINDIKEFCLKENIILKVLPIINLENEKISSSKIKAYLKDGNIEKANILLLENYSITQKVVYGKQLGRILGFPTMNFCLDNNKTELKNGVYIVYTKINKKTYFGICNYGTKPTFNDTEKNYEVHLLNFCKNMYNKNVKIYFAKYIRDIKKFNSREELINQLNRDLELLNKYINSTKE